MANVYYDEIGKALVFIDHRFSLDDLKAWVRSGMGPHEVIKRICEEGCYNPTEKTLAQLYEALQHASAMAMAAPKRKDRVNLMVGGDRWGDRW